MRYLKDTWKLRQFFDVKDQSLWKLPVERNVLILRWFVECETCYCLDIKHLPPKKKKQHKLECFIGKKQFLNSTIIGIISLDVSPSRKKGFCFESKQAAPSMKMVISHHFSFRWKTFMLRIIMWWKKREKTPRLFLLFSLKGRRKCENKKKYLLAFLP